MQKKIIALAVAGLMSGAAFAQSNVTISGRVDVGYQATTFDGLAPGAADKQTGIGSGIHDGSRIAFAGEEGLGNGLKAIFMLEYRLANDINAGIGSTTAGGARQQYLGLAGNFGTVTAGYIYTPSDDMGMFDSMDQTNFSPRLILADRNADNVGTRFANAVKYVSPTISGFTAQGIYGYAPLSGADTTSYNGNTNTTNDQSRGYGAGVSYANGPLTLGLYYDRVNDVSNTTGDDATVMRFGGSYDFGPVALYHTYEKGSLDSNASPATGFTTVQGKEDDATLWSVGLTAPLGNGLLRTMYAKSSSSLTNNGTGVVPSTCATAYNGGALTAATSCQNDGKGWGIGYDYNLSKRTMLYTGYAQTTKDFDVAGQNDYKVKTYGFGMLHKF